MSDTPLAGLRVLVTRAVDQAEPLCHAIEAAGGTPVRFPVVHIEPHDNDKIAADLADLPNPDMVVFVSPNAVRHGAAFFSASDTIFAAVGRATAAAMEYAGLDVSIDPGEGFTSEALLDHDSFQDVAGRTVVIVRGEDGRALLGDTLRERGATVHYLPVYQRQSASPDPDAVSELVEKWRAGGIDCVTVMSVATLEFLLGALPDSAGELVRNTPLVAPGERVIQTAGKLLPGIRAIQASGPLPEDMVSALVAWRHSGTNQ